MTITEKAVQTALEIAADNSHGYDQASRWGADYDCSSLVITAWETAGVPVKTNGATYTGNMKRVFLANGFEDVIGKVNLYTGSGLMRGDVLLNERSHTAMHIGNGQIVHASGNEFGGAVGGQKGDQTGKEITVRGYYNSPWDCVLRYTRDESPQESVSPIASTCTPQLPIVRYVATGEAVRALQQLLVLRGHALPLYGVDGDFGRETEKALKAFQYQNGLESDAVVGEATWQKLIG